MKRLIFIISLVTIHLIAFAQPAVKKATFTRADSLRGSTQSPLRNCYDINYYHLDVKVDIDQKFISGSNLFKFTATQNFNKLQFDLFANLTVEKVLYKGKPVKYKREFNSVFVTFPKTILKGSKDEFTVYYSGKPTIAKRAPWDGGFVFSADSAGKPWVVTACEGVGASIWWPNKDQTFDEVDSMLISVSAPKGLKDISNGRLRKTTDLKDGYTRFDWFVANPINNYDVAVNIADYQHIGDSYDGEKGKLTLDYWVLPEHIAKATKQFGDNVKPMLKAFEHWFGPYPWYEDGYKLIETPHLGMEHQSAVAYGNKYQNGYLGTDRSQTGWGLKWDFIIVHESGHEWFGNNITMKDEADEWIHESFTTYAESLFVETYWGKPAAQEYIHGQRNKINNDEPIIGPYNVNRSGSADEYEKGSNMINMIRCVINDDEKWLKILRGLNQTFYHQTVTAEDIIGYINKQSGLNLTPIFDQYLRYKNIPTLEFRFEKDKTSVRWVADVNGFTMPVRVRAKCGEYKFISPSTRFRPIDLSGITKDNLEVDTLNYYIGVLVD